MATIDDDGFNIDTLDDVVRAFNADFADDFGSGPSGIDTSAQSFTGRQNIIIARRVVLTQQLVADALTMLSPANASGRNLDFIATLFADRRTPARRATIPVRCYGKPAFAIGDRRVRYKRNNSIWRVPLNTTIGATGYVDTELEANVTGVTRDDGTTIEAFQDGTDQWVIVDSNINFTAVESTADYLAGSEIEGPASFRARFKLAGRSSGTGTEPGVRRSIYEVAGVNALVDNNRGLGPNENGVTGKSIEVVVDEGDDSEVAQAVYDSFSDTSGFFGSTAGVAYQRDRVTGELDLTRPVAVRYTRAAFIQVAWHVVVDTSGSEEQLPDDAETLIIDALAEYTNTTLKIGRNVVPEEGSAAIRAVLPAGSIPQDQLAVTVGLLGGALSTTPVIITSRQSARTDPEPQSAEFVSTNVGPFNIVVGQVLQLAVNGGTMQEVTFAVADFQVVSAATALEIATAINNRTTGIEAGSEDGALVLRSETTGATSTLQIGAGSTAGLLTVLGLTVDSVNGTDGNITVEID